MSSENDISARQKRTQQTVFRKACERDLSLKVIAADSNVPYPTIQTWASGSALMSIAGLYALVGVIPDDLLSMLLPDGRQIVKLPEDLDHDALSDLAADYLTTKAAAHKADSPAGVAISACEKDVLDRKVVALRAA